MKKNRIFWMFAVLMLISMTFVITGCQTAPRVIAELTEHYPARQADSVMVYELGEQVPAEAKVIGTVKVTDGGMTPSYKCLYGSMLSLARRQKAEETLCELTSTRSRTSGLLRVIAFGAVCFCCLIRWLA